MTYQHSRDREIKAAKTHRGGVTLPEECWEWLRKTADGDESTRDDLIEGLVLLAMDGDTKLLAELDRLRAMERAIRELHQPRTWRATREGRRPATATRCRHCERAYPCSTIRALDGE